MESRLEIQAAQWDKTYDKLMKALNSKLPGRTTVMVKCMDRLDVIEKRIDTFTPEEQEKFWHHRH